MVLALWSQEAHSRCWEGQETGAWGKDLRLAEGGGLLVLESWERSRASKGSQAREFGEGRECSHKGSEGRAG